MNALADTSPAGRGCVIGASTFSRGDVLLANVNLDGNGHLHVVEQRATPRSFSSHSAVFRHPRNIDGDRFPVVIETYEKGVRPVPSECFSRPAFLFLCRGIPSQRVFRATRRGNQQDCRRNS